jgi:hypothetical protein
MRTVSFLVLAILAAAAPLAAGKCDTDVVPAATLLFPYFEVDLEETYGRTTLVSISNISPEPAMVKVALWTDWAVPSVSFHVYLTGYDVQTLNLRDVLAFGRFPSTGSGVSPQGEISNPNVGFPGCNGGTEPGEAPVYEVPALDGVMLTELQALHTGEQTPLTGKCAAYPYGRFDGERVARGYVTADVVRRCSDLTPADSGYFATDETRVADERNVLTGDYALVNPSQAYAQGDMAVHVEAFPEGFGDGDVTFYGRYVASSGADQREPLGTRYAARYVVGGAFSGGTRFHVWRDTGSPAKSPVTCAELFRGESPVPRPTWASLRSYVVYFDEEENAVGGDLEGCVAAGLENCFYNFPWATQEVRLSSTDTTPATLFLYEGWEFGIAYISLRNNDESPEGPLLQGWVSATMSAEGLYSLGQRALRLDSACNPEGDFPISPRR